MVKPYFSISKNKYQEHSDLNWKHEVWSFLFYQLNYTLYIINILIKTIGKEMNWTSKCKNTQYLANILPYQ